MSTNIIRNVLNLSFFQDSNQPREDMSGHCPHCSYTLDRPHALFCTRCGTAIPQAKGCSGCGRCRKR